ncbi:phosphatidylinositol-4-phosphate 5-Kinase, partial [Toxoplasma gondii RUB]
YTTIPLNTFSCASSYLHIYNYSQILFLCFLISAYVQLFAYTFSVQPRRLEFTHRLVDPCLLVLQPAGLISPALLPPNLSLSGASAAGDTNKHLFLSSYHRYLHNFESSNLSSEPGLLDRDPAGDAGDKGTAGLSVIDENCEASPARKALEKSARDREQTGRPEGDMKSDGQSLGGGAAGRRERAREEERPSGLVCHRRDGATRRQVEEVAKCSASIKVLLTGSDGREMEAARIVFLRTCMGLLVQQLLPPWTDFVARILPDILRDIHDPNVIVQNVVMDKLWRLRGELETATGLPCGFASSSRACTHADGMILHSRSEADSREASCHRVRDVSTLPSCSRLSADSLSSLPPSADRREKEDFRSKRFTTDRDEKESRKGTRDDRRDKRETREGEAPASVLKGAASHPSGRSEGCDVAAFCSRNESRKRMHVSLVRPMSSSVSVSSASRASTTSTLQRADEADRAAGDKTRSNAERSCSSLSGPYTLGTTRFQEQTSFNVSNRNDTLKNMLSTSSASSASSASASSSSASSSVSASASRRDLSRPTAISPSGFFSSPTGVSPSGRRGPSPSRASLPHLCSSPTRLSPVGQAAEALEDFALTNLSSKAASSRANIPIGLRLVKRNAITQNVLPRSRGNRDEGGTPDVGGNAVREDSPFYALTFAMMLGLQMSGELSACLVMLRHKLGSSVDLEFLLDEPLLLPVRQFHFCCYPQLPRPFFCVFEDLAPDTFECARELAGVTEQDYRSSMCRTDFSFIEFESNSKSGQFFLFSHDGKYLIKTIGLREVKQMLKILPAYVDHLLSNPNSLLTRLFGLHRVEIYKRYDLEDEDMQSETNWGLGGIAHGLGEASARAGVQLAEREHEGPSRLCPGEESPAHAETLPVGGEAREAFGSEARTAGRGCREATTDSSAGHCESSPRSRRTSAGGAEFHEEEAAAPTAGRAERDAKKVEKGSLRHLRNTVRTSLRPVPSEQANGEQSSSGYAFTIPRSVRYRPREEQPTGEDLRSRSPPKKGRSADQEKGGWHPAGTEGGGGEDPGDEKTKAKSDSDGLRGRLPFGKGAKKKSDSHKALRHAKSGTYAVRDDAKKQSVTCAYFAVIGTAFDPYLGLHEAYDLKGSTVSRRAKPHDRVKKDVDWLEANRHLNMRDEEAQTILRAHRLDCEFLETISVFDYSLLVGVHRCKQSILSPSGSEAVSGIDAQGMPTPLSATRTSLGPLRQYTKMQQRSVSLSGPSPSILSEHSSQPLASEPVSITPLTSAIPRDRLAGGETADSAVSQNPATNAPSAVHLSMALASPFSSADGLQRSEDSEEEDLVNDAGDDTSRHPEVEEEELLFSDAGKDGRPQPVAHLASCLTSRESHPAPLPSSASVSAGLRSAASLLDTRPCCLQEAASHGADPPLSLYSSRLGTSTSALAEKGGVEREDDRDADASAELARSLQQRQAAEATSSSCSTPRCYCAHVSMPCPPPAPGGTRRVTMRCLASGESGDAFRTDADGEFEREKKAKDGETLTEIDTVRSLSQPASWPEVDSSGRTQKGDAEEELGLATQADGKHRERYRAPSPATSSLPHTSTAYTFLEKSWMGTAFMSPPSPDSGFGVKVMNADMTEIYYLGIIDFLTPYDWRRYGHTVYKRLKSSANSALCGFTGPARAGKGRALKFKMSSQGSRRQPETVGAVACV